MGSSSGQMTSPGMPSNLQKQIKVSLPFKLSVFLHFLCALHEATLLTGFSWPSSVSTGVPTCIFNLLNIELSTVA